MGKLATALDLVDGLYGLGLRIAERVQRARASAAAAAAAARAEWSARAQAEAERALRDQRARGWRP